MEPEPLRCFDGDALMRDYHDREWGRPVMDERGLFERLSLEAFQSGISWSIVLRKREALRRAFFDFQPDRVARLDEPDVERLMQDPSIIRNRAKITAVIVNARATLALRDAGTSLPAVIWSHRPEDASAPHTHADVPSTTDAAKALADDLKGRGFRFVGPTTAYATMQAAGLVNDHLAGCHVRDEVQAAQEAVRSPD